MPVTFVEKLLSLARIVMCGGREVRSTGKSEVNLMFSKHQRYIKKHANESRALRAEHPNYLPNVPTNGRLLMQALRQLGHFAGEGADC